MTSPTSSAAAGNRLILAVSFSGPGGSLALSDGREPTAQITWEKEATASETATLRLEELLAQDGRRLGDLTHILVNNGPGSFTGIRVGLNLARTLGYALGRPVGSLDALTTLGHKYLRPGERRTVALKAVRNYFYAAGFSREPDILKALVPPHSVGRADPDFPATEVLIEGETPDFDPHAKAADLLRAYLDLPKLVSFFSWDSVKPLYIRGSEAEEKLRK